MWNKYLWDCCCCWRPIKPAELTGTRAALNIRSYQNFPYRILRQWWRLHFQDIPLLWIRLHGTSNCGRWGSSGSAWRAAKFYQIGKGEEEVIHAGNEDLQFELQGVFFNWASPEFAKCWLVSNWFKKKKRQSPRLAPPNDWKTSKCLAKCIWFQHLENLRGGQSKHIWGGPVSRHFQGRPS